MAVLAEFRGGPAAGELIALDSAGPEYRFPYLERLPTSFGDPTSEAIYRRRHVKADGFTIYDFERIA